MRDGRIIQPYTAFSTHDGTRKYGSADARDRICSVVFTGFSVGGLLALLVAPIIQRRIVRFAEDRLKATMPISPAEVRAQKDAVRAAAAAEQAKTLIDLRKERDRGVALMVKSETLASDLKRTTEENRDLQAQIARMSDEAADMRVALRDQEKRVDRLKEALDKAEEDGAARVEEVRTLLRQIDLISADIDRLREEIAGRDTEIDSLRSRNAGLRDERETIREELKAETAKARAIELQLARDETRLRQMESRLTYETSSQSDKDLLLERRAKEIDRLKSKLKDANGEVREAMRALRSAGIKVDRSARPTDEAETTERPAPRATPARAAAARAVEVEPPVSDTPALDVAALTDETRNRATALSERLANARKANGHDEALRSELADVAAAMVAITASREGPTSPIHGFITTGRAEKPSARRSLARRVADILPPEK